MKATHCDVRARNPLHSLILSVAAFASTVLPQLCAAASAPAAQFEWFEYTGRDEVFELPLPAGHYRNPILAGFYPDPSITRAGDKFYLVNSTFAYFPGIPVFESEDLVHWRQVGNAIDRPSQLDYRGLGVSRAVFAPAIEYHNGLFYILNTHVDGGGNYIITAKNPAGPWSDPTWLPSLEGGIDPSLFVDEDGRAYIVNNGPPEGTPQYQGHRAIWIQELDLATLKTKGPRKVLVNGGIDISQKPVWIEGPHLFKREGWYYLNCAEGGTGPQHSQVILRSRSPWGPFEPGKHNPILTQRDLPADRADPITNAGHADLVQAPDGSWWATFLATRTYADGQYNTGRETFLLPVTWKDGWPVILKSKTTIPYVAPGPKFLASGTQAPLSGNFTWRDEFDRGERALSWLQLRAASTTWWDLKRTPGLLTLTPTDDALDSTGTPALLAHRQQHLTFDASTALRAPEQGVAAGLVAFQNETHWFFLGVRRAGEQLEVFLERRNKDASEVVARRSIAPTDVIQLKVTGARRDYSFAWRTDGAEWRVLKAGEDGSILSTEVAGGFVGAVVGPYARKE